MKTFNVNLYLVENEVEILVGSVAIKATGKHDAEKRAKQLVSFICLTPGETMKREEKKKWSDTLQTIHARSPYKGPDVGLSNNARGK